MLQEARLDDVFARATDAALGRQLWISEGSAPGTATLTNAEVPWSFPGSFADLLKGPEVTLLLEDAGDFLLGLGVRGGEVLFVRHRGVLEAREEIRNGIGDDSHGSVRLV